jgi:hypothetical protein
LYVTATNSDFTFHIISTISLNINRFNVSILRIYIDLFVRNMGSSVTKQKEPLHSHQPPHQTEQL